MSACPPWCVKHYPMFDNPAFPDQQDLTLIHRSREGDVAARDMSRRGWPLNPLRVWVEQLEGEPPVVMLSEQTNHPHTQVFDLDVDGAWALGKALLDAACQAVIPNNPTAEFPQSGTTQDSDNPQGESDMTNTVHAIPQAPEGRTFFPEREDFATMSEAELIEIWGEERVAAKRAYVASVDAMDEAAPATPPCPAWCAESTGHRYENIDATGAYSRYHSSQTQLPAVEGHSFGAFVTAIETNLSGVVTIGQPFIASVIGGNMVEHELNIEEASLAAEGLLAASKLLRTLTT